MALERLQKILAHAGIASRRKAEEYIRAGRVRVGGRIVEELGTKADPRRDEIRVDGRRIVAEEPVYLLLHKPRGCVSSREDPEGRDTVVGLLRGVKQRVYPVGRLEYNTSGALLLTNDGALAQKLLRRDARVEQVFAVKVRGEPTPRALDALRSGSGSDLEVAVQREGSAIAWLRVVVKNARGGGLEWRSRRAGLLVARMTRTSFAGLTIDGLRPGESRALTAREVARLSR